MIGDVRQKGPFEPIYLTYGSDQDFPPKSPTVKIGSRYGAWRNGDNAHTGYNKTFGGQGKSTEYLYLAEGETERPPAKVNPVWLGQPNFRQLSMPFSSIISHKRNSCLV